MIATRNPETVLNGHIRAAARKTAALFSIVNVDPPPIDPSVPIEEDDRTKWRRRLQQRRCLACGAAQLHNRTSSYFCSAHIRTHRYCSTCETLRERDARGKDSRCKSCASARALARYHANPGANLYRLRLKQMARRERTREDQIFDGVRRRIALAAFVKRTPGMSWPKRAAVLGVNPTQLAASYRTQLRDDLQDADASDRARERFWEARS